MSEDRCGVYVVASRVIADGWPRGICFRCGERLADHEKRVSSIVPDGPGFVIDEQALLARRSR